MPPIQRIPEARRLSEREATELLNEQAERLEQAVDFRTQAVQADVALGMLTLEEARAAEPHVPRGRDSYAEYRERVRAKEYEWEDYDTFKYKTNTVGIIKEFNEDQVAKAKRIGQIKKTDFFLVLENHIACVRPYRVMEEADHTHLAFKGFAGEYTVGKSAFSSKEDAINCLVQKITKKMQKQARLFKQNKDKLNAIIENPDSAIKKGFL